MTRFFLLLLLLCAACFDARFGDPPALRATSAALSGLADAADNATVQARSEKAYRATMQAGDAMSALAIEQQRTAWALSAEQTRHAGTVTAQAQNATATIEKMQSIQDSKLSGVQADVAIRQEIAQATLAAVQMQATSTALEREERLAENRAAFMRVFPWAAMCSVLMPVFGVTIIYLLRNWNKSRIFETHAGTVVIALSGPPVLLSDISAINRYRTLLKPPTVEVITERPERAELERGTPEREQDATTTMLLKASELDGWYGNRIPGHRELEMGGSAWHNAVTPLREHGWVETSNQGTEILDGRNLGEVYYLYLETL